MESTGASKNVGLVDVSDIFLFCSGQGKGESKAPGSAGGGGRFVYCQKRAEYGFREYGFKHRTQ